MSKERQEQDICSLRENKERLNQIVVEKHVSLPYFTNSTFLQSKGSQTSVPINARFSLGGLA